MHTYKDSYFEFKVSSIYLIIKLHFKCLPKICYDFIESRLKVNSVHFDKMCILLITSSQQQTVNISEFLLSSMLSEIRLLVWQGPWVSVYQMLSLSVSSDSVWFNIWNDNSVWTELPLKHKLPELVFSGMITGPGRIKLSRAFCPHFSFHPYYY